MFRNLVLASVAALGLIPATAMTADAADIRVRFNGGGISIGNGYGGYNGYRSYYPTQGYERRIRNHYRVLYRSCHTSPWQEYGCYDCRDTAYSVAHRLEHRGLDARVFCD